MEREVVALSLRLKFWRHKVRLVSRCIWALGNNRLVFGRHRFRPHLCAHPQAEPRLHLTVSSAFVKLLVIRRETARVYFFFITAFAKFARFLIDYPN